MTQENRAATASGGRSHLGAGSRIAGELYFPGTVELPGLVKGRVEAAAIVIEETGEVEGELHAASITIKGRFSGDIAGGAVRLTETARVHADISYESLTIDIGAELDGRCKIRSPNKAGMPEDQENRPSAE